MKCMMACVVAGVLAVPAMALAGKVKIESVKVETHEAIPAFVQNSERGLLKRAMVAPEGKVFLSLTASLKADWDEKTAEIKLDAKKSGLFDGNTQLDPIGLFTFTGVFSEFNPGADLRRPWDFRPGQAVRPTIYHRVFLVAKGTKALTLRFEDVEAPVSVPEKPVKIEPAAVVDVKIESAELKDSLEFKTRSGPSVTYANPDGKVLVLNLKVTPKEANVPDDSDRFVWMAEWLALDLGKGMHLACAGMDFMDGISFVPHNPNRPGPDKAWPTDSVRVYFAVPANMPEATLTWLCAPVAKVQAK